MMTNTVAAGTARSPISVLGVPFDHVTTRDVLDRVEQMILSGRPHYAVTANVDFVVQAQEDLELHRILFNAHLVLCDGAPIAWASRLFGNALPERVAGADLVPILIRVAAEKRRRLFFLGASPAAAERAARRLREQYPDLAFEFHSPPFTDLLEMNHEDVTRRIRAFQPDILFVAMGCPKQEKWIAMHYRSLGVPLSIGVGATIDFLSGRMKRAPVWMQRSGTEWLFRLAQEPRRLFKRYAKDIWVFGLRIAGQYFQTQMARRRRVHSESIPVRSTRHWQWIRLPTRLDASTVQTHAAIFERLLADERHCLLDAGSVKHIDSTGAGLLSKLQKSLTAENRHLVLLAPGRAVRRALKVLGLENFFACAPLVAAAEELIEAREREESLPVTPRTAAAVNPLLWVGEITASNAAQVWDEMRARLTAVSRPRELVVDLSGLRFLDSSGVDVMLKAQRLASERHTRLCFINASRDVKNVLRYSRYDKLLSRSCGTPGVPALPAELTLSQQA